MKTFDFPFTVTLTAADPKTAKMIHAQIKAFIEASGAKANVCEITDDPERAASIVGMAQELDSIREGEVEVDDGAIVSEGDDNGAYVAAWAWVSFKGTDLDKKVEAVVEAALKHSHDNDYQPGADDDDMLETAIDEACLSEDIDLSERQIAAALRLLRDRLTSASTN